MSLREYEEFVYRAGFLYGDDPNRGVGGFWGNVSSSSPSGLGAVRELRVVAEGTDLTLGVGGRTWIREPSGRAELPRRGDLPRARVESATEGTIRFTYPAAFQGRIVDGVRASLRGRGGRGVRARAAGEEFLREMIAIDDGRAARGGVRLRDERRDRGVHAQHALRREDRRHRPPRARQARIRGYGRARTAPRSTGTWCATSGPPPRSTRTARSSTATGASSTARAAGARP